MSRLAALLGLATLLATAGAARADVFATVSSTGASAAAPSVLPSSDVPNTPGSLLLPAGWTQSTPTPQQLDYASLLALWQRAGAGYGIPWQVLGAINKIESNFGQNMGPSSAGAVGWMQFMPETWMRWGMDASGDRVADPWNPYDGVYSAARYLAAAGGRTDIERAIFAYNHADWYVRDVLELARTSGEGDASTAFSFDAVAHDLAQAQSDVIATNEALVKAVAAQRRLARAAERLYALAEREPDFSARLAAQKRAALAGVRSDEAASRVAALRDRLRAAEEALANAQNGTEIAGLAPPGTAPLASPVAAGGYVFPVGGGPSVVSVSRTHHDYPAADIAAPAGAPLYALADGAIVRAWHLPDARCGIGFTMRTADGLVWTYCHLAYLDPSVRTGVVVGAGAAVGLVGSTGHSTGPHLHLQLQPATAWPQQMPWFQAFAGSGFRWQGEAAPAAAPTPTSEVFAARGAGAAGGSPVVAFTR